MADSPVKAVFLPGDAPIDCTLCPRLVAFRAENKIKYPDFYNGPVPSFGDPNHELLIVGLAPNEGTGHRRQQHQNSAPDDCR